MSGPLASFTIRPALAAGMVILAYALLLLGAVAFSSAETLSAVLFGAAFLLPGAIGGYLTSRMPLAVGAVGALGGYAASLLISVAALGQLSFGLLLFSLPGDVAQAAVTCGGAVAAFTIRKRLQKQVSDAVI